MQNFVVKKEFLIKKYRRRGRRCKMKIGDILTVVGYDLPDYIYFKNRRLPEHIFTMDVWLFRRHVEETKRRIFG